MHAKNRFYVVVTDRVVLLFKWTILPCDRSVLTQTEINEWG
jgi:hypothetical protein